MRETASEDYVLLYKAVEYRAPNWNCPGSAPYTKKSFDLKILLNTLKADIILKIWGT